ncbi:MAG: DNA translocase FtsK 4TM domain-containing protein [Bacteroidia bacterium]
MARKDKDIPIRNTLRDQADQDDAASGKAEEPEKKEKAPKPEKNKLSEKKEKVAEPTPKSPRRNPFQGITQSIQENERLHKVTGAFLLFIITPYLLVAFTSYLFNWQSDQNKVSFGFSLLFDASMDVNNLLGKLGALVAHAFIHKGFGVTSYLLAFLSLVTGLRILFKIELVSLLKALKFTAICMVLGSVVLGYLFSESFFVPGGAFGFEVSTWLNSALGKIGTGFLLGFSILTWLIIVFNISFNWFAKKEVIADEEIEEPRLVNPVNILKEEKSETPEIIPVVKPAEADPRHDIELTTEDEEESILWEEEKEEPAAVASVPAESTITVDDTFQVTVQKNEDTLSPEEIAQRDAVKEFGEYDPTLELGSYQFPPIDLLESYGGSKEINVNTEELTANKDRILKTLGDYGIEIDKIKATIGPTVTLYEIIPKAGVRIAKIKNLEDDIALSLSALGIRIIAPIPGKGTIGIEVPNLNPEIVPMRSILASEKFQSSTMDLPVALGKTISNETFITDLAKMPHLLMAGATGQGKSVGLNALLVSLLYKKHPSQIKFVLVDPKKVELTLFNKIERHFLAALPDSAEPIITDTKKVVHTLNSLCIEMDNRYDLLKEAQVRNIKEYNAKFIQRKLNPNNGHKFLPYIVVVIDEFADLIMTAGKEVETPIARIAQLARAVGIHLIIATQRPSVNIITGTIKANFPARIAFRVTSKIDSRTILDSGGAEQLIGRGDMLLSTGNDLIRLQCAFVDTPEVERVCEFIGSQRAYPDVFRLPEYVDEDEGTKSDFDPSQRDAMFDEAARIVVTHQQGSASLLQRKLKLGYNRAGRIVDQLESMGIIGKFEGSKAREVLIKDLASLETLLKGPTDNN